MVSSLIYLIVVALVVGILLWLVFYIVDSFPVPDPPNRIIKIVATVIAVLVLVVMLLNLVGINTGIPINGGSPN